MDISLFLTPAQKPNKFVLNWKSVTEKIVNILKFSAKSWLKNL